jgi:hypothetical protein
MTVRHHALRGRQQPDYVCQRAGIEHATPICQSIRGASIDTAISGLLISALTPLAIEAALTVAAELENRAAQADALVMLAEIGDITRFASARKLASWAGLTPTVRGSDLTVRHGHISKQGSPWLRWVLNQAAQTAKRSPEFSATYAAIAKRRGKKIATIAISRKLLTRAYHLLAAAQAAQAPGTSAISSAAGTATTRTETVRVTKPRVSSLSRTHGHGARLPVLARRRMGACETTPPATRRGQHTTLHKAKNRKGLVLASDNPPPLVGVQLVRPRRYAGAGAPA